MAANRFKNQSKYKNAFAQVPKREFWLQDVLAPSEFNSLGRAIGASTRHTCFCWETPGTLALYPLGLEGRLQPPYSLLKAHSAPVTDLEFSPFFEDVLATAGEDKQIKLWRIEDASTSLTPTATLSLPSRVEGLSFNPYADSILASCSDCSLSVYDLNSSQSVFTEAVSGDLLQSLSWGVGGRTLGVVGKDRVVRSADPRAKEGAVLEVGRFTAGKEFQVQCLPEEKLAISSLTQSRDREISIWDVRACKKLNQLTFGNSNRTMSMLFDPDTNMLLLGQRGEVFIHYLEFSDTPPYVTKGASYLGNLETRSLCLVPKRAVDVMRCEINRILQLTKREIVPIPFVVTRKSYIDFHSDLYPDTIGTEPGMSAQEWMEGLNRAPKLTTLNPQIIAREKAKIEAAIRKSEQNDKMPEPEPVVEEPVPVKPVKVIPGLRSTPFKHLTGSLAHKSTFIFDLPPLCKTIPLDGRMLHVSLSPDSLTADGRKDVISGLAAVPLQGAGGQIALIPIQLSGRLLKSYTLLENSSNIIDLAWDRFNPTRLVVAGEDSNIRVWNVTPENLESGQISHTVLDNHRDRPSTLSFHPHASSLFVSSGFDCQLLIWDLDASEVKISLSAPSSPIVSLAWSQDGYQLATFNRDCFLHLYSPLDGTEPIWEGSGPTSGKAARIIWLSAKRILISGFEKVGTKVFYLMDITKKGRDSILTVISVTNISSPSLLIPHFDTDTSVVYFTTRGESLVFVYEYLPGDSPYFFSLSPLSLPTANQELFFFPKVACQVRESQVARGVRLTQSSLEEFGFKVPRVRLEFFQDDIFPLTEVTWEPLLTAGEWLSGNKTDIRKVSLKPADMTPLSKAPALNTGNKSAKSTYEEFKSASDHEKELVDGMIQKMRVLEDKPLKQDLMEGVDDNEWDD